MPRTPLTKLQAERICRDYQYLIGKEFTNEYSVSATIEAVAVSPYDDVNKYIFLLSYRECNDAAKALEQQPGELFDVLVLGRLVSEKVQVVYRDLVPYLQENGIEFDIAKYTMPGINSSDKQMSPA